MTPTLLLPVVIVATSVLGALAALMLAHVVLRRQPVTGIGELADGSASARFVFDNRTLVDANDRAHALLRTIRDGAGSQDTGATDHLSLLLRFLEPHFPDLTTQLATLADRGRLSLTAADGSDYALEAEWKGGLAHLALAQTESPGRLVSIDQFSFAALEDELKTLRHCAGNAPVLIWREDAQGNVIWANGAYLDAAARSGDGLADLRWPLPILFDTRAAEPGALLALTLAHTPHVFEHHASACDSGVVHYAIPADAAAQAEITRRELLQTLTRAFSTLPIGLAVFDRSRRLQIFNPALTDLTGLPSSFLARRPSLEQVLHALREARVLPEPRDFKTWRASLLEIEQHAEGEGYQAEWHQPGGQTLHVAGHPHPDGGLAFFLEDVTSETSLARSFRTQIEAAQTALDALPEAQAVFGPDGTLVLANTACHTLWGTAPESVTSPRCLEQAVDAWASRAASDPIWSRIAALGRSGGQGNAVNGIVTLRDGTHLDVSAHEARGRMVVIRLRAAALPAPPPSTLDRARTQAAAGALKVTDPVVAPRTTAQGLEPSLDPGLEPGLDLGLDLGLEPGIAPQSSGMDARPASHARAARVRHVSSRSGVGR